MELGRTSMIDFQDNSYRCASQLNRSRHAMPSALQNVTITHTLFLPQLESPNGMWVFILLKTVRHGRLLSSNPLAGVIVPAEARTTIESAKFRTVTTRLPVWNSETDRLENSMKTGSFSHSTDAVITNAAVEAQPVPPVLQ